MLRRSSLLACSLWSLCFLLAESDGSEPIPKGEVPTIKIGSPGLSHHPYDPRSNIAVSGRISRQLRSHQNINLRFYHVLDNKRLIYQHGGSVQSDEHGYFGVSFDAPAAGWKPGVLRIYAVVEGYSAVTGTAETRIANVPVSPRKEVAIPEPRDSGVVIDTDDPRQGKFEVQAGAQFRIRGEFKDRERFARKNIGLVQVEIRRLEPNGQAGNIIIDAKVGDVFHDENGEAWFEVIAKAPEQSGMYAAFVQPSDGGPQQKQVEPWVYELQAFNEPDEPADAAP